MHSPYICIFAQQFRVNGADTEEDVVVDSATSVLDSAFKCGLSKQDMKNPKVAPCGHVFSAEGFSSLFSGDPSVSIGCPESGCSAKYTESELVDDFRTTALMKHSQGLHIKRGPHDQDEITDFSDDEFQPAVGGAALAERPIKAEPKRK